MTLAGLGVDPGETVAQFETIPYFVPVDVADNAGMAEKRRVALPTEPATSFRSATAAPADSRRLGAASPR